MILSDAVLLFYVSCLFQIKSSIKVLQEQEPVKVEGLLNTLRFVLFSLLLMFCAPVGKANSHL